MKVTDRQRAQHHQALENQACGDAFLGLSDSRVLSAYLSKHPLLSPGHDRTREKWTTVCACGRGEGRGGGEGRGYVPCHPACFASATNSSHTAGTIARNACKQLRHLRIENAVVQNPHGAKAPPLSISQAYLTCL